MFTKLLKNKISLGLLFFGFFLSIMMPIIVFADDYGLTDLADETGLSGGTVGKLSVPQIIGKFVGAGLSMISVLFFILVLYGGLLWMTAHGHEDQAEKGRDVLIQASIGLVIVVAAYALTKFVFGTVGADGTVKTSATSCEQMGPGWGCQQIATCGLGFSGQESIDEQRDVCSGNSDTCALNLCPNSSKQVVCCKLVGRVPQQTAAQCVAKDGAPSTCYGSGYHCSEKDTVESCISGIGNSSCCQVRNGSTPTCHLRAERASVCTGECPDLSCGQKTSEEACMGQHPGSENCIWN